MRIWRLLWGRIAVVGGIALFCASICAIAADTEPPAFIASPDGKSSVRILQQAMPGADAATDFFTLEVLVGEAVVARVPTMGYLLSAHWRPDGTMVAVNNRRGNSGDYLWVFSLPDGACYKRADDPLGQRWIYMAVTEVEDKVKEANAESLYRNWMTAEGWTPSGELRVVVRTRYREVGTYDFQATATLRNGKLVLGDGKAVKVES